MRSLPLLFVAIQGVLNGTGHAQCTVLSVTMQAYGASCPPTHSTPWINARFSAASCTIDFMFFMPGSTVVGGWLGFSLSPQQSVYPELGACPLMTSPFAIASVMPSWQLALQLPPGLPPTTLYVNGVDVHWSPIFNSMWAEPASFGLQLTIQ